ncbi:hypothetical protein [Dokdonella sp.]|uniref:hypothetical protein n=1 Tax=Dokdonella sp. TaxID=2291710 RepID=UPI0025BBEF26|nr:hypothetical protein [Dokdonella sp.]MBX3691487.1 hypothetical protein [Dokdonella sp.]MCW5567845.1 hypothetical protein [Dokdonella sp.]
MTDRQENTMMTLLPRTFRIRRAAMRTGEADTLHVLEWLGGEAFVVPPPCETVDASPQTPAHEDPSPDWRVL